jgi:quercetin dioxygenase-like cupin family protein
MEYLRKVDFAAFAPDRFSYQVLAETERAIIVVARQPAEASGEPRAPHYHLADQVFYMLEGVLEIEMDGVTHRAGPGDTLFIPAGTIHSHRAVENEMHLDILSPAPTRGAPLSRRADEPPPTDVVINPHSPPMVVVPGKPAAPGWVLREKDVPVRHTHVPGFDVRTVASRALGSEHALLNVAEVMPGPGPDWHIHVFDQFYYVLGGVLTVEIANRRYEVQPHEFMVIPAGVPHRNWNNGATMERHLAILQPEPPAGQARDVQVAFEIKGAVGVG